MDWLGDSGNTAEKETRRATWCLHTLPWLLLGIGLLEALLRLLELHQRKLWADEIFNIAIASRGPWGIFSVPTEEEAALGPLDPMILGFIAPYTNSVILLKLPSALIGVLTIFLLYKVVSGILGQRVALLSALLLAISHYHIHYSQEARFYALFTFTSLLSLYFFFVIFLRGKRGFSWWMGHGFSMVLVIYSHLFGFFVLFSQGPFGLWLLGHPLGERILRSTSASRLRHVVSFGLTMAVALAT